MKRVLAILSLILSGTLSPVAAGQATGCDDVAAYLKMVDAAIAEEMYAVVSAPGWAEAATGAQATIEANDGNYETMALEEIQPLLDYLGVAGRVLDGIESDDVPESARELHDTAADYWTVSVEMIEVVITEGGMAAYPYVERYEDLTVRNIAAQEELRASCVDILLPYEEREDKLNHVFEFLDSGEGAERLADVTLEDLEGIGYFFLFFGDSPASGAADATPATVVTFTPES